MRVCACGCVLVGWVCVGGVRVCVCVSGGDTRGASCGYRPLVPNACRSKHSIRACVARRCTWSRFACESRGWSPCLDYPRELFRTVPIAARSGVC